MLNTKLSGEYRIEVRRNNQIVRETDWFDNLILDSGLDRIGAQTTANVSSNSAGSYCRVGTGSSNPNNSQSTLDSQIASTTLTSASGSNLGGPNYINQQTAAYTFAQGAVVGNITEVGVGWAASGSSLFSRALIADINGNPTAITLTSIDQLTIYYRLNVYPPLTDSTGTLTINGTNYNWTARVASVGSWGNESSLFTANRFASPYGAATFASNAALGPITGSMSGTSNFMNWTSSGFSFSVGTYVSGSYYSDSYFSFGINAANMSGGIGGIQFYYGGTASMLYQVLFSTPIPKDNTKTFTIGNRISWSRI